MGNSLKIDLHLHSVISDGSDTPSEILAHVKRAEIGLFSITDHDAIKSCEAMREVWKVGDPHFLSGVEFSCKDEEGQYHILGYGYDPESESIEQVVHEGHNYRMRKCIARLDFLKSEYQIDFPADEVEALLALNNPGKPHLGNLMVKYGYAATKEDAIFNYINNVQFESEYVRPEDAIKGILDAGGITVLAHPSYGNGDQIIVGGQMEERLERLIGFGLQGVEAYYSGFTKKLQEEMLYLADRYDLYVTAGSDYHGKNKMIAIGDTNLGDVSEAVPGLQRFLQDVTITL